MHNSVANPSLGDSIRLAIKIELRSINFFKELSVTEAETWLKLSVDFGFDKAFSVKEWSLVWEIFFWEGMGGGKQSAPAPLRRSLLRFRAYHSALIPWIHGVPY